MRRVLRILFIYIFLSLLFCATSFSQTSIIGRVQGEIVDAIQLKEEQILNFGKITVESDGTLTISPNGERVANGNLFFYDDIYNNAIFKICGRRNSLFCIQMSEFEKLKSFDNGYNLVVTNFKTSLMSGNVGQMDDDGYCTFQIGATLNVPSNLKPGFYSGTYNITASYQ